MILFPFEPDEPSSDNERQLQIESLIADLQSLRSDPTSASKWHEIELMIVDDVLKTPARFKCNGCVRWMTKLVEKARRAQRHMTKSHTPQQKPKTLDSPLPMSVRLPGSGPLTSPGAYTSEKEIREQIFELLKRPQRKLSAKEILASGVADDAVIREDFKKSQNRRLTEEEKQKMAEEWVDKTIASTRQRGRLMTEVQLADWRIGRRFGVGDKVRWIGPTRDEKISNRARVPRPHGQEGTIVSTEGKRNERVLIFHPDSPELPVDANEKSDKFLVDLEVREFTKDWMYLERIVSEGNAAESRSTAHLDDDFDDMKVL